MKLVNLCAKDSKGSEQQANCENGRRDKLAPCQEGMIYAISHSFDPVYDGQTARCFSERFCVHTGSAKKDHRVEISGSSDAELWVCFKISQARNLRSAPGLRANLRAKGFREMWEIANRREECFGKLSVFVAGREKMYLKRAQKTAGVWLRMVEGCLKKSNINFSDVWTIYTVSWLQREREGPDFDWSFLSAFVTYISYDYKGRCLSCRLFCSGRVVLHRSSFKDSTQVLKHFFSFL